MWFGLLSIVDARIISKSESEYDLFKSGNKAHDRVTHYTGKCTVEIKPSLIIKPTKPNKTHVHTFKVSLDKAE